MKLLLFNYAMDENSQLFSHQKIVAEKLLGHFDFIDVITVYKASDIFSDKLSVSSTGWENGKPLLNILKFYKKAIPKLFKHRRGYVFSHMTEVQSFLIAIICRVLGIRHVLWYAHKSKSPFLYLAYPFIDVIATSTKGSCPIESKRVKTIGQAIDAEIFNMPQTAPSIPPLRWYHIGRLDPSKNLEAIIDCLSYFRDLGIPLSLDLFGTPSSNVHLEYARNVRDNLCKGKDWVKFHGAVNKKDIPKIANDHDGFIHAYMGSLDKAVLEAVFARRVVISCNPEFMKEFSSHSSDVSIPENILKDLLGDLFSSSQENVLTEIERRYDLVMKRHELNRWIQELTTIIKLP